MSQKKTSSPAPRKRRCGVCLEHRALPSGVAELARLREEQRTLEQALAENMLRQTQLEEQGHRV